MAGFKWYISLGSQWLPLDDVSAVCVEYYWSRNESHQYINCDTFPGAVYVNFEKMVLTHDCIDYMIARVFK